MRRGSPPALACWLLESVLPLSYREAILGDLTEEYLLRASSMAAGSAWRWFWSQTSRSVLLLAWASLRSGWVINTGVAAGVYLVMAVLKFAADLMISKWLVPEPMTRVVVAPILFLTISAIGGCVAARIRRGATVFLALIVAITVVVLIAVNPCAIPVPWWYQFGFLTFGPLTVLIAPAILVVPRAPVGKAAI